MESHLLSTSAVEAVPLSCPIFVEYPLLSTSAVEAVPLFCPIKNLTFYPLLEGNMSLFHFLSCNEISPSVHFAVVESVPVSCPIFVESPLLSTSAVEAVPVSCPIFVESPLLSTSAVEAVLLSCPIKNLPFYSPLEGICPCIMSSPVSESSPSVLFCSGICPFILSYNGISHSVHF